MELQQQFSKDWLTPFGHTSLNCNLLTQDKKICSVVKCLLLRCCTITLKTKQKKLTSCVHMNVGGPSTQFVPILSIHWYLLNGTHRWKHHWENVGRYLKPMCRKHGGLPLNWTCNMSVWKCTWMTGNCVLCTSQIQKSCWKKNVFLYNKNQKLKLLVWESWVMKKHCGSISIIFIS